MSTIPRSMMESEFEVYGYNYENYNSDDEEDDDDYNPFDEYRNDVLYEVYQDFIDKDEEYSAEDEEDTEKDEENNEKFTNE
jgi:hypothetical protein